jgi:hypothetical protein
MITIIDVLAAGIEAQVKVAEWEAEFQEKFYGPLKLAERVQAFLAMPLDERAALAPEEQARMGEHARRMQQTMGQGPRAKGQGG